MPSPRKTPSLKPPPLPPVTDMEIDGVRRRALRVVTSNFPRVQEVLDGQRKWSASQVKLFQACLNKVLPDVRLTQSKKEVTVRNISELPIEELARIAMSGAAYTDAYYEDIPEDDDTTPADDVDEDQEDE